MKPLHAFTLLALTLTCGTVAQAQYPEYLAGSWIPQLGGSYPTIGLKSKKVVDLAFEPSNDTQLWVATADSGISFWGKIDFTTRDYAGYLVGPERNWLYYQTEIFGAGDGQRLTAMNRQGEYVWITNQNSLWLGKVNTNANHEVASIDSWWQVSQVETGEVIQDMEVDSTGHAFITTQTSVYHSTVNGMTASWDKVVFPEGVYTSQGTKHIAIDGFGRAFIADHQWVVVVNADGTYNSKLQLDYTFQIYNVAYESGQRQLLIMHQNKTNWYSGVTFWDIDQGVVVRDMGLTWQNMPYNLLGGPADQAGLYWIGASGQNLRQWNGGMQNSIESGGYMPPGGYTLKAVSRPGKGQTWLSIGGNSGIYVYQYNALNAVEENQTGFQPDDFSLSQNYPNPFNGVTAIDYTLPISQTVNLAVYDIQGRVVESLVDDVRPVGTHRVVWTPGPTVPSGLYIVKLSGPGVCLTRKVGYVK